MQCLARAGCCVARTIPWLTEAVWPLLRQQALEKTVHFAGTLSGQAVYEHLAAGDVHVNPTLCEGLNMVTVEAAAVGTPTITSDGAGIADWVERLQAGAGGAGRRCERSGAGADHGAAIARNCA